MQVKTSTAHTVVLDDGREFALPISDPYDNNTITDTMIVTDHTNGTTLSYLVTDDCGRDWSELGDEVFSGWEYMVLDSQRDADELSAKLNDCESCGYGYADHLDDDGNMRTDLEAWLGCDGYIEPPWRTKLRAGRAFLFEKYEHGLVNYALQGEASMVDRQWDVSPVAGIIVADDDWGADVDMEKMARSTLRTFTDWCNGEIYAVIHAHYDNDGNITDVDTCWGYIGGEHALACLKEDL
jgi:hypothetical protein